MALQKTFTDDTTTAIYTDAYHRAELQEIKLDVVKREATIIVYAFVSKAAADTGKSRVAVFTFSVSGAEFDTWFGNPLKTRVYTYLKTLPAYAGSVDV